MVQKYLLAWNSYHWKVPGKHPLPSYTATSTLRQNMLSSAKCGPFWSWKPFYRRFDHLWSWKGTLIKTISKNRYLDVCSWWLTGNVTRKPWLTRAPRHPQTFGSPAETVPAASLTWDHRGLVGVRRSNKVHRTSLKNKRIQKKCWVTVKPFMHI